MKKFEVFFYGNITVEADDEESAVAKATEYLNENSRDFTEVKEVEE